MRRALRWAGAVGAVLVVAVWAALGANLGWTKSSLTRMEKDPVTEIEFPVTEKQFSPGINWLGGGLLLSALLGAVSIFVGRKPNDSQTKNLNQNV